LLEELTVEDMLKDPQNWKIVSTAKNAYYSEINKEDGKGLIWETKLREGFLNMDNWRLINLPSKDRLLMPMFN
jgi:hypothetical protein